MWVKQAPGAGHQRGQNTFSHDSNPNAWAQHDVGQAVATLAIQAVELGLQIHQMAGFSADAARAAFGIPEGYDPVAVFTIGYPGDPDQLPDALQERETGPPHPQAPGRIHV
ncbi:MAG: nitroreductase family protein [Hymenobacter sp.]